MRVLTVKELVGMHAVIVRRSGGSVGLRDRASLEATAAAQTQVVFGEELYPTIVHKAAALTRGIIGGHPFIDGNKRTGMMAGIAFLLKNGQAFKVEPQELEDFAVKIATDRLDIETIAAWYNQHVQENESC